MSKLCAFNGRKDEEEEAAVAAETGRALVGGRGKESERALRDKGKEAAAPAA